MGLVIRRANRQYLAMTEKEFWDFVEKHRVLMLATVSPDCTPNVTPVWYVVDNGKIYFSAQDYKQKIKNIKQNPKVCFSAEEGERFSEIKGVSIEGFAKIIEDKHLIERIDLKMKQKYSYRGRRDLYGEEIPEEYVRERERETHIFVEVTPTKVSSWDNSKIARKLNP